ncbi:MAG: PilC/PilY family type IV pilus protein [Deltaproteobacteria bacterium]|nr:PilC/PilY family type IV pilus protein [Deltaproteobacteria bacterium]
MKIYRREVPDMRYPILIKRGLIMAGFVLSLLSYALTAGAAEMADYTAFPAFLPRTVSPNILFLLDNSASTVRPAYGRCDEEVYNCADTFVNIFDDYSSSRTYDGYFDPGFLYLCDTGGCDKESASVTGNRSGNWLNWLVMTQFDIVKKTAVGGDVVGSPEQGNPQTLKSRLTANNALGNPIKITKVVNQSNCPVDCSGPAMVPQEIPYSWVATPATYTQLASGNDNAWVGQIDFPFAFTLYSTTFPADSVMTINVNGWAAFEPSGISKSANYKMPTTELYDYAIAPYWIDQELVSVGNSEIQFFIKGTAPNRVAVLTFLNVVDQIYDEKKLNPLTYQVLFFERGSHIVFQYQNVQEGATTSSTHTTPSTLWGNGALATIGVQGNISGGKTGEYKLRSHRGLASDDATPFLLRNNLALLMTPKHFAFDIRPVDNSPTVVVPSAPFASSANEKAINIDLDNAALPCVEADGWYRNKLRDECYDHETEGLYHELRDGLLGGSLGFRLAIMQLNDEDGGSVVKSFNEKETTGWPSLMAATRSAAPVQHAPLAEALYLAQGYFREDTAYRWATGNWNNSGAGSCSTTGNQLDPFCYKSAGVMVTCCKNFILLVSGGNYSHDFKYNIYDDVPLATDQIPLAGGVKATDDSGAMGTRENEGWLDNVAYKAHVTDLRDLLDPGDDDDGMQTLNFYAVDTYGEGYGRGTDTLKKMARYGGFNDYTAIGRLTDLDTDGNGRCDFTDDNGNGVMDGDETGEMWESDIDCDGTPDTYFSASGGENLKGTIMRAVMDILKSSASGTSVSVLSTSSSGEGAMYQAYFYPARVKAGGNEVRWPGYIRSYFVDADQYLRDDHSSMSLTPSTSPDRKLVKGEDYVVEMDVNEVTGDVAAVLSRDIGASDEETVLQHEQTVPIEEVTSLFEAGEVLAKKDKSTRNIYAWLDSNADNIIDNTGDSGDFNSLGGFDSNGELMKFKSSMAAELAHYLRAGEGTDGTFANSTTTLMEAEDIIAYVRGENVSGFRARCLPVEGATTETFTGDRREDCGTNQRIWALGDIVYSTPTLVGNTAERYYRTYGDTPYRQFHEKYRDRRRVIYVGSNDGLLHAFNAGVYDNRDDPLTAKKEDGTFRANPATGSGWGSPELGEELWAFVPHDVLPHLVWTTCNGSGTDPSACGTAEYTHTYYVDQRPKATDAQIFADDTVHPGGWGTMIIVGMRFGGGAINVDLDRNGSMAEAGEQAFRSAYYAFDVTDPERKPRLLWRFTHENLGFASSYPAIAKSGNAWFMVVGSGPENNMTIRDYGSNKTTTGGHVFIVDLATGEMLKKFDSTSTPVALPSGDTYMGSPSTFDFDEDFSSETIYIGSTTRTTVNVSGNSVIKNIGKVFRINTMENADPNTWVLSTFFSDPDMGPLVEPVGSAQDVGEGSRIFFGTGRLQNADDISDRFEQRFYGIEDKCIDGINSIECDTTAATEYGYTLSDLVDTTSIVVTSDNAGAVSVDEGSTTVCTAGTSCSYEDMANDIELNYKGWYISLEADNVNASQRVLSRPAILSKVVMFTAYEPAGDLCSIFGEGTLYALDYLTGTATQAAALGTKDIDGNTKLHLSNDSLGKGMPTSVGLVRGRDGVSGFVQTSSGKIVRIDKLNLPGGTSAVESWRQSTEGMGTIEIEEIYKMFQ